MPSTVVENRVVEMEFDNKRFESNIKDSISSIERLKEALTFRGLKDGFEDIEKSSKSFGKTTTASFDSITAAANNINLSNISDSIAALEQRFSTFGIVGKRVIEDLTDSTIALIKRMNAFLTGGIVQGGIARAMKIQQAKFQLEGLGITWKNISNDIDYAVSGTAYGLDSAAAAAAQLVASGVEFGETFGDTGNSPMAKALRGISGVAAMTNSSYDDIARIFTTVAGNGRLMSMQLVQLGTRGLNAASTLAQSLGKTEGEIREMVSKGQIDFNTFSKAMDDAFGEHAKDADRTFTGVMSNIRAALSRIGADFVQPLIESNSKLIRLLQAIKSKINDVRKLTSPIAELFSKTVLSNAERLTAAVEAFDVTRFADAEKIFESFVRIFYSLKDILKIVKESFKDVFPDITAKRFSEIADRIKDISDSLQVSGRTAKNVKDTFTGIFSVLKNLLDNFVELIKMGQPIYTFFGSLVRFFVALAGAVGRYAQKQQIVNKAFAMFIQVVRAVLIVVVGLVAALLKAVSVIVKVGLTMRDIIRSFSEFIKQLFEIERSDRFDGFISNLQALKEQLIAVIGQPMELISLVVKSTQQYLTILRDIISELGVFGLSVIAFALLLARGVQLIIRQLRFFSALKSRISGFIGAINATAETLRRTSVIMSLAHLANTISLLAISLFVLTSVDSRKLIVAAAALGILMAEIGLFTKYIAEVAERKAWIKNFGARIMELRSILMAFSTATLLLSVSIRNLSKMSPQQITASVIALNACLWSTIGALKVLTIIGRDSSIDPSSILNSAKAMKAMAVAMLITSVAIRVVSKVPARKAFGAVVALETVLWSLVGVIAVLKRMGETSSDTHALMKAAESMLVMSIALRVAASAINALKNLSFGQAVGSVVALEIVLWSMVGVIAVLKKIGETSSNTQVLMKASQAMLVMSIALRISASAIKSLQNLNLGNAVTSVGSLEIILWSMVGVIAVLKKIGETSSNADVLMKASKSMIVMAIALRIAASSVKSLRDLNFGQAATSVLALEVILWSMVGVIAVLKKMGETSGNANVLMRASKSMVVMAIALRVAASAINALKDFHWKDGGAGFIALEAILWSMVGVIAVLGIIGKKSKNKDLLKAAGSMIIMSIALKIAAGAINKLKDFHWKENGAGLAAILITLGSLTAIVAILMTLSGTSSLKLLGAAAAIVVLSYSLKVIAKALNTLENFHWKDNGAGFAAMMLSLGALTVVLIAFTAACAVFPPLVPVIMLMAAAIATLGLTLLMAGAGLKLGAQALDILTPALKKLAGIGSETLRKVAEALGILAGPLAKLGFAGWVFGTGSLGIAIGLTALGKGLTYIQNLDFDSIQVGLTRLSELFGEFVTIGHMLEEAAPGYFTGGIAILMTGAGLVAFGNGLEIFTKSLAVFMELDLSKLSGMLPEITSGFEGILSLSLKMGFASGGLISSGFALVVFSAGLKTIAVLNAALIAANATLLTESISGLAKTSILLGLSTPLLMTYSLAMFLFAESVKNVAEAMAELKGAGTDAVTGLVEGTESEINSGKVDAVGQSLGKSFLHGFSLITGWHSPWSTMIAAGKDAYTGLKNGVNSKLSSNKKVGLAFGDAFINGIRESWDWHSPPGIIIRAIADCAKAMISSAKSNEDKAEESGGILASSWLNGFDIQTGVVDKINGVVNTLLSSLESGGLTGAFSSLTDIVDKATEKMNGFLDSSGVLEDFKSTFEELKSSTLDADDITDKLSGSVSSASDSYDSLGNSASKTKTFVEQLTDTIEQQMDIFTEFNSQTEISGEQMLNNMASQVSGVRQWAENLKYLAERGIDDGLLQKLTELGPAGYEKVAAFVNMTDEQLQMAGSLFQESLSLPESTSKEVSRDWWKTGEEAAEGFTKAVASPESTKKAADAGKAIVDATTKEIKNGSPRIQKEGSESVVKYVAGQKSKETEVQKAGERVSKLGLIEMRRAIFDSKIGAKKSGEEVDNGLVAGMNAETEKVAKKTSFLANLILTIFRGTLAIASPSKETFKIGQYFIDGFVLGLAKSEYGAQYATEKSALGLIMAFNNVLNTETPMFSPTVRPVLDLDSFNQDYSKFSSIMDAGYSKNLSGSMHTYASFDDSLINALENIGDNSDVVDEVRTLSGRIADMTQQIGKMQVVLDSGAMVGALVTPLDQALGNKAIRSRRERR